jgi:hypothetical protein
MVEDMGPRLTLVDVEGLIDGLWKIVCSDDDEHAESRTMLKEMYIEFLKLHKELGR